MTPAARDRRSKASSTTSSFSARSTTEDVLRGIDLAGKTALLTVWEVFR